MGAEAANVHSRHAEARQDIKKAALPFPAEKLAGRRGAKHWLRFLIVQDWGDWQRAVNKKQNRKRKKVFFLTILYAQQ